MRADADAALGQVVARVEEYRDTGGPFPARLPVIALITRLFAEQAQATARWAAWAEEATTTWTGVTPDFIHAMRATFPPGAADLYGNSGYHLLGHHRGAGVRPVVLGPPADGRGPARASASA